MSDYYIIGANRTVAVTSDASTICSVENAGTTYVYWHDTTPSIQMSKSTDGKIWSTPVAVWTAAVNTDVRPAGVVWNGTAFIMALATVNTISGAVTTSLLSSANGTTFASLGTVTFTEYWAHPTDLVWTGTYYYLAATVRNTFDAAMQSTVKRATSTAGPWTSLGRVDQVTATDNVWPRIVVSGSDIHLVHREGNFTEQNVNDRILHTVYTIDTWQSADVVMTGGTGNPDITALNTGYAVLYKDQSVEGGRGIWSWLFYDGDTFYRRGTFSQDFEYGMGACVLPTVDGFDAIYATSADMGVAAKIYSRGFYNIVDEPTGTPFASRNTEDQAAPVDELPNFRFEASYGSYWVDLADGSRFYISPDNFGIHAQTLRRITAQSPFYDGTYLIHSVRENVTESLAVNVLGVSANDVTENLLLLEEIVSQPSFRLRMTVEDHVETWSCQAADYTIERGHIMLHNTRALMRIQVPRLPEVTYEVT